MRTRWTTTFATLAVLAACAQSEPDDRSEPAPLDGSSGGTAVDSADLDATSPSSDAEMVAYDPSCDLASLECCPPRGAPKCVGLGEVECSEARYCFSFVGYLILPPGRDAGTPRGTFLGCRPTCFPFEDKIFAVAFDPADPSKCYGFNPPVFPEGWIEVELEGGAFPASIPAGMCGT